jgi:hypothetical protein
VDCLKLGGETPIFALTPKSCYRQGNSRIPIYELETLKLGQKIKLYLNGAATVSSINKEIQIF